MATSKYVATLRTNVGTPLQDARVWIVPTGNTYPYGALELSEHATILGRYYRLGVSDGEYDIWIDPAGASTPSLYDQNIYHAEVRLTTISNFIANAFDLGTGLLKAAFINMTEVIAAIPDATTSVRGLLSVALKTAYDAAVTASHSHSNKSTLDSYTQTEVNLADAVSKKHAHSNLSKVEAVAANSDSSGALGSSGLQSNSVISSKIPDASIPNKKIHGHGVLLTSLRNNALTSAESTVTEIQRIVGRTAYDYVKQVSSKCSCGRIMTGSRLRIHRAITYCFICVLLRSTLRLWTLLIYW
jgi:hypothetical protein